MDQDGLLSVQACTQRIPKGCLALVGLKAFHIEYLQGVTQVYDASDVVTWIIPSLHQRPDPGLNANGMGLWHGCRGAAGYPKMAQLGCFYQ